MPEKIAEQSKTQLSEYDRRFLAALDLRMPTVKDEVRLLVEGKY